MPRTGEVFHNQWFASTLGQGLQTSTYPGEVIFSIALAILGLILFALLIGNMQNYLQSLTIQLEEMRVKRHDSEQWMHHRLLPLELRERVRRYDQYKWLEMWALDPKSRANLLSSTRIVKALTEVEAFVLIAEELKFVASQFRHPSHSVSARSSGGPGRLASSKQLGDATPSGSSWRFAREEMEPAEEVEGSGGCLPSLGATIYALRFAANALRGVHDLWTVKSSSRVRAGGEMLALQKLSEPDFTAEEDAERELGVSLILIFLLQNH